MEEWQFSPPYLEDGSEAQRQSRYALVFFHPINIFTVLHRQRAHDDSAAAADVISSFTFPGTYTRCQHPQCAHLFYPLADSGTGIDCSLRRVSPFMNPAEFGPPSFPPGPYNSSKSYRSSNCSQICSLARHCLPFNPVPWHSPGILRRPGYHN